MDSGVTLDSRVPATKYHRLMKEIRLRVDSNEFKPGTLLPCERTLAEQFNLSRGTVRTALKKLEATGLILRVHGQGTFVVERGRGALDHDKRTAQICMIVERTSSDVTNDSYYGEILKGLLDVIGQEKIAVNLIPLGTGESLEEYCQHNGVSSSAWDGVIFGAPCLSADDIRQLQQKKIALVCLGRPDAGAKVSHVDVDNVGGAHQAISHLLHLGRRRILIVDDGDSVWHSRDRYTGYCKALEEAGIQPDPNLRIDASRKDSATEAVAEVLKNQVPFDAVFAYTYGKMMGVWKALDDYSLVVPQDVALVVYNDHPVLCFKRSPALTAIRQPFYEVGSSAGEILLEQLRSDDAGTTVRFVPPLFLIRESCGVKQQVS